MRRNIPQNSCVFEQDRVIFSVDDSMLKVNARVHFLDT